MNKQQGLKNNSREDKSTRLVISNSIHNVQQDRTELVTQTLSSSELVWLEASESALPLWWCPADFQQCSGTAHHPRPVPRRCKGCFRIPFAPARRAAPSLCAHGRRVAYPSESEEEHPRIKHSPLTEL